MLSSLHRFFAYKARPLPIRDWKIVRGDTVTIRSGKDKGKIGTVEKVYRKTNRLLVKGVNIRTKHISKLEAMTAGREKKESPIPVSIAALIDPETKKPTRVKYAYLEDGSRVRIAKKSGAMIPKPVVWLTRSERGKDKVDGEKDTPAEIVLKQTYFGEDFAKLKEEFEASVRAREEMAKHLVFPE